MFICLVWIHNPRDATSYLLWENKIFFSLNTINFISDKYVIRSKYIRRKITKTVPRASQLQKLRASVAKRGGASFGKYLKIIFLIWSVSVIKSDFQLEMGKKNEKIVEEAEKVEAETMEVDEQPQETPQVDDEEDLNVPSKKKMEIVSFLHYSSKKMFCFTAGPKKFRTRSI